MGWDWPQNAVLIVGHFVLGAGIGVLLLGVGIARVAPHPLIVGIGRLASSRFLTKNSSSSFVTPDRSLLTNSLRLVFILLL